MQKRLIKTDLGANNNKFWHAKLNGSSVELNWGRVGAHGQFLTKTFTSEDVAVRYIERTANTKQREGYVPQQTMSGIQPNVGAVAKVQIQHSNDAETTSLIDFLVQRNIHTIEGTTSIRLEAGKLTTPLGPVTANGLNDADNLIQLMALRDSGFPKYVNQYLSIVPRDIGRRKLEPSDLFGTDTQLAKEQALVDSLRAVVRDIEQKASDEAPPIFETKLQILDVSAKTFDKINTFFKKGINDRHASSKMRLHRVWEMAISSAEKEFEKELDNIWELWHGTKDANLLSILKNGYVIPRRGGSIAISGRMYGDGIYFSDQSTKSLNYTSGFWGGGGSKRHFMLLNDVAMGKIYTPNRSISSIAKDYDSCFAKAGKSGVINNEMIVYRKSQVNPKYLCEFR